MAKTKAPKETKKKVVVEEVKVEPVVETPTVHPQYDPNMPENKQRWAR